MAVTISRRTLALGSAWAAPAVMVASTVPAFAASSCVATGQGAYYTSMKWGAIGGRNAKTDQQTITSVSPAISGLPEGAVLSAPVTVDVYLPLRLPGVGDPYQNYGIPALPANPRWSKGVTLNFRDQEYEFIAAEEGLPTVRRTASFRYTFPTTAFEWVPSEGGCGGFARPYDPAIGTTRYASRQEFSWTNQLQSTQSQFDSVPPRIFLSEYVITFTYTYEGEQYRYVRWESPTGVAAEEGPTRI